MALLFLKKLIVGGSSPSSFSSTDSATETIATALRRDSDASVATVTDLEAQPLLPGRKCEKTTSGWEFRLNARVISDATIGLSDGLTVPFALTAGLSTLGSTRTVWLAGLAELVAGAISMGLGGWLGAKSELYVFLPSFYAPTNEH
jgi:VIT1/CCC1 family predicted Fe2+/Mn2+ transporter